MLVQKETKHARGYPETPRTGTPARNGGAVTKRGLNGAYRVPRAHLPPSPPLPRSGGGEGKGADAPAAPYKHRLAHASGRHRRSERAFRCVGSRGIPERVLLPFARAKGSPRRIGVQTKLSKRLCDAVRRHGTNPLFPVERFSFYSNSAKK